MAHTADINAECTVERHALWRNYVLLALVLFGSLAAACTADNPDTINTGGSGIASSPDDDDPSLWPSYGMTFEEYAGYLAANGIAMPDLVSEIDAPQVDCFLDTKLPGNKNKQVVELSSGKTLLTSDTLIEVSCRSSIGNVSEVKAAGLAIAESNGWTGFRLRVPDVDGIYRFTFLSQNCRTGFTVPTATGKDTSYYFAEPVCISGQDEINFVRDTAPPIASGLEAEETEGVLRVGGKILDLSGGEIRLDGTLNGAAFAPMMTRHGSDIRIQMPLRQGTNGIVLNACDLLGNCGDLVWGNGQKYFQYDYNPLRDIVAVPSINGRGELEIAMIIPNAKGSLIGEGGSFTASQEHYLRLKALASKKTCEIIDGPNNDPVNPKMLGVKVRCSNLRDKGKLSIEVKWQDRVGNTLTRNLDIDENLIPPISGWEHNAAILMVITGMVAALFAGGLGYKGIEYYAKGKRQGRFEGHVWTNDLIEAAREIHRRETSDTGNQRILEAGLVVSLIQELVQGRQVRGLSSYQILRGDENEGIEEVLGALGGRTTYLEKSVFRKLSSELNNGNNYKHQINEASIDNQLTRLRTVIQLFAVLFRDKEPEAVTKKLRTRELIGCLPLISSVLGEMNALLDKVYRGEMNFAGREGQQMEKDILLIMKELKSATGTAYGWLNSEMAGFPIDQKLTELRSVINEQILVSKILLFRNQSSLTTQDCLVRLLGPDMNGWEELVEILLELKDYESAARVLELVPQGENKFEYQYIIRKSI